MVYPTRDARPWVDAMQSKARRKRRRRLFDNQRRRRNFRPTIGARETSLGVFLLLLLAGVGVSVYV